MADIVFSLQDIIFFSAFLGSLSVIYGTYIKLKKPIDDHKKEEELQNKRLGEIDSRCARESSRMSEIEDSLKILVRSQLALIDHAITSNGVDRMKTIRKELEEYLINR